MKITTMIVVFVSAVIFFGVQWDELPDKQQTLSMGSAVHFNVRKKSDNDSTVYQTGNSAEYSLNISLSNMSDHLVDAVVASEDRHFFERGSAYMVARSVQALVTCVKSGSILLHPNQCAGNSAITQQLAKILWIGRNRSLARKIKELFWAVKMEAVLSKEEILELYLNRIPLGSGVYGVEMAARRYFSKPSSNLSLEEAAIIVASVRRPSVNWANDKAGTIRRANIVLDSMYRHGFIAQPIKVPQNLKPGSGQLSLNRPFLGHAWQWLKPRIEQALVDEPAGYYKVYTSINAEVQIYAEKSIRLRTQALRSSGIPASQGAVIVMKTSGQVLAMVGGADKSNASRFINRAIPVKGLHCRPPASLLKVVLYTAALELGLSLDHVLDASPFESIDSNGKVYRPQNHDGNTYAGVPLSSAYVHSVNTAAVRLLADIVRYDLWFNVAKRYGLPVEKFRRELGLALGQPEVCMIDMMRPFGIVASGGLDTDPHAVLMIVDGGGRAVMNSATESRSRIFDRSVMESIHFLSSMVVQKGTGSLAGKDLSNIVIAGKTGTTDGFQDAWFIGYANRLVIGVWIGNDVPVPMPGNYGGSSSAVVFNKLMTYLIKHTEILHNDGRRS